LRYTALMAFVVLSIGIVSATTHAQQSDDLDALNRQALQLYQAGKYAEATDIANRALALAERQFGLEHPKFADALSSLAVTYRAQHRYAEAESLAKRALAIDEKVLAGDHPQVAGALTVLATLYEDQGRFADAEPLYKRALAIAEKALGPDNPDVGAALTRLAGAYVYQGRYAEAEPLYQRALANAEKAFGPDHSDVGAVLTQLADLYVHQGRYAEAEPVVKRALAIEEKAFGPDHPEVVIPINVLANTYIHQGRYAEAEPLLKRALATSEKTFGPEDPSVGAVLDRLGALYEAEGRYAEAEPIMKRGLAISEKVFGPDDPNYGTDLNSLGILYADLGRYAEAEPLMQRALAIAEKALGPSHPDLTRDLEGLAELYRSQGRYAEAEPLYKQALAIDEKALGPDHLDLAKDLNNLALLHEAQGHFSEAESLFKRSLAVREKALGPDQPAVANAVSNLGTLYRFQGRDAEAESLYRRALAIDEQTLGPDHPHLSVDFNNLADLYFSRRDWVRAADYWQKSTRVIIKRVQNGRIVGEAQTARRKTEVTQVGSRFWGLLKSGYRLEAKQRDQTGVPRELFQTAQWAQSSEAAESLSLMAARAAKNDPKLAAFVRELQDLEAEWQWREEMRISAFAQAPDKRNHAAEAKNVDRLAEINARKAVINEELAAKFPDYVALAGTAPLSVEAVQRELEPDEALLLFLDTPEYKPTPEETFVWVVTKTGVQWVRSNLGTPALIREVAALRCGLDYHGAWFEKGVWDGSRCNNLLKVDYTRADHDVLARPLPFDAARAHELYRALFAEIEDLIKDKRLLIVPSGALTQLPFQVLVTKPPKAPIPGSFMGYKDVAWLARKHAITVLPAVSSLKALRELAKQSHASEPYIGFGDPLLDGQPTKFPEDAERAKLAREKHCDPTLRQRLTSLLSAWGGTRAMTHAYGGSVDLADLRSWAPLPETADELCDVAHDLGVDPRTHLYLGAMATEDQVKHLSRDGFLAKYRIVHFATHGAVAGEISNASEPGLVLTPPDRASETNDGYLSASEIAGLKLDADWVMLSACNTAAGDAKGAEALSGLARAFFYAGARSLLVSHWEVASEPTVKLITKTVNELKRDPKIGRAEALRRSILSMVDTGKNYEAHPAFWAPFVIVGEGGAAR